MGTPSICLAYSERHPDPVITESTALMEQLTASALGVRLEVKYKLLTYQDIHDGVLEAGFQKGQRGNPWLKAPNTPSFPCLQTYLKQSKHFSLFSISA